MLDFQSLRSLRIGLALSGGSVRGLAHIGVVKALNELGIRPTVVAGTSAGSLIGAGVAAGLDWQDLSLAARSVFWPSLLHSRGLKRFCLRYLPSDFSELSLPFAAVTTEIRSGTTHSLTQGCLVSAISASCALRGRRPVTRAGLRLKDGGFTCVLPTLVCRQMGAEIVIASDVWEVSWALHSVGMRPGCPRKGRFFPSHYRRAIQESDLLVRPDIPFSAYSPRASSVDRMIRVGEAALHQALQAESSPI